MRGFEWRFPLFYQSRAFRFCELVMFYICLQRHPQEKKGRPQLPVAPVILITLAVRSGTECRCDRSRRLNVDRAT
jgi:hypothetical protein